MPHSSSMAHMTGPEPLYKKLRLIKQQGECLTYAVLFFFYKISNQGGGEQTLIIITFEMKSHHIRLHQRSTAFSLSLTHSVVFIQTCANSNTVMNKSWASVCVQQLVVVLFLFEYQTGGVCYSQTIIYKYIYIYQLLEH